jgi:uncharacterized protein (TIRG00374 family)
MANLHVHSRRSNRLKWVYVLVCLIGMYGIVPQLGDFHHSFSSWQHLQPIFLIALLLSCVLTYLAAATTYVLLAFKHLRYGRTLLVEVASMFVNRLLPAGVGGIGTNYTYLRKAKLTSSEASTTVAVNNLLGFAGHLLLVFIVVLVEPSTLKDLHLPKINGIELAVIIAIIVVALSCFLFIPRLHSWILRGLINFTRQLVRYRTRRLRLSSALLSSVCLTLANVCGLWFAAFALHIDLSFVAVLVVFTLGVGIGTVTPTPGGIGGLEAGLVAGLVAYHLSAATAVAIVLLYRLVSFWLALLIGALLFVVVKRRKYL